METEKKIIGTCPVCGGNVVKTCKGYRCEHNIGENPTCNFTIHGILGNRKMNDTEIATLLAEKRILLDGFATKEGKTFTTILVLGADGTVNMDSTVARCPLCGGEIRVGAKSFSCANFRREEAPCNFGIWRNIGGHLLTEEEVREICEKGITAAELDMFRDDGSIYRKRLGLSPDKTQIVKI